MGGQTSFEKFLAQCEERTAHDFAERFFKIYAPVDRDAAARFHADLLVLMNRVRVEAQEPLVRQMSNAMALAQPVPALLRATPEKG